MIAARGLLCMEDAMKKITVSVMLGGQDDYAIKKFVLTIAVIMEFVRQKANAYASQVFIYLLILLLSFYFLI